MASTGVSAASNAMLLDKPICHHVVLLPFLQWTLRRDRQAPDQQKNRATPHPLWPSSDGGQHLVQDGRGVTTHRINGANHIVFNSVLHGAKEHVKDQGSHSH